MAGKKSKKPRSDAPKAPAPAAPEKSPAADARTKWRWRPLIISLVALSLLVLFLSWIKFFDLMSIDRHLQNLLISYVGNTNSSAFDSRVALILVDETNQPHQPFGVASPAHRKYHAALVRGLYQAGAKVVVFDVAFRTNSAEFDPEFALAIQEAEKANTKVVVGAFLPPKTYEPQLATAIKSAVGDNWGIYDGAFLNATNARFIRLAAQRGPETFDVSEQPVIPSLALQAVRQLNYPNQPTTTWFSPLTGQVRLRGGGSDGVLLDSIPVDDSMDLRVDLPGKADITRYSYQEVLSHLADYAGNFKDKVVVIGYQKDDQLPGTAAEPRYGAEVHATAISTLLSSSYIRPLPVLYHYLLIVVLVAVAAYLQIRFTKWMDKTQTIPLPFLPAPLNKITIPTPVLAVSIVYLLVAVLAFMAAYIVFEMTYHLAALILTHFLFVVGRSKFVR